MLLQMVKVGARNLPRLCEHSRIGVSTGAKYFSTSRWHQREVRVNQSEGEVEVGDYAFTEKTFSKEDMLSFAEISGDNNPLHLDEEYAKTTPFGRPIVYGALTFGLLSGTFATYLPGPGGIVVNYTLQHPAPLYVGEAMVAQVEVIKKLPKCRILLKLTCTEPTAGKIVAKGESICILPKTRCNPEGIKDIFPTRDQP